MPISKETKKAFTFWGIKEGAEIMYPLEDYGYFWVYFAKHAPRLDFEHVLVTGEFPPGDLILTREPIDPLELLGTGVYPIEHNTIKEFATGYILAFYEEQPGPVIIANQYRDDWAALVHPCTRPTCKWQGSKFDPEGPWGHVEGRSLREVIEKLVQDGFTDPDPGAMERAMGARANPPYSGWQKGWWSKPLPKDTHKISYKTKRDALNVFLDWNRGVVDDYGGESMKHSPESFEAINHKFGITGNRRVDTIAKAVWWALPPGSPYYLEDIDVHLLNETAPAIYNPRGLSFSIPDHAEEQKLLDQEGAYWQEKYGDVDYGESETPF